MLQQVRLAMANSEHKEFFDIIVENDETYVDGKPRKGNDHIDNDKNGSGKTGNKHGRGTDKTPVVGITGFFKW